MHAGVDMNKRCRMVMKMDVDVSCVAGSVVDLKRSGTDWHRAWGEMTFYNEMVTQRLAW